MIRQHSNLFFKYKMNVEKKIDHYFWVFITKEIERVFSFGFWLRRKLEQGGVFIGLHNSNKTGTFNNGANESHPWVNSTLCVTHATGNLCIKRYTPHMPQECSPHFLYIISFANLFTSVYGTKTRGIAKHFQKHDRGLVSLPQSIQNIIFPCLFEYLFSSLCSRDVTL